MLNIADEMTSFELSKWLHDREFLRDSDYWYWREVGNGGKIVGPSTAQEINKESEEIKDKTGVCRIMEPELPAYRLVSDICGLYVSRIFDLTKVTRSVMKRRVHVLVANGRSGKAESLIKENSKLHKK